MIPSPVDHPLLEQLQRRHLLRLPSASLPTTLVGWSDVEVVIGRLMGDPRLLVSYRYEPGGGRTVIVRRKEAW